MDGRLIRLAIILTCSTLATQNTAHGFWNRPGNLAHYVGYGTGAGLHAPMGCTGNCNRMSRRQPVAIPNCPTCTAYTMPSVQQFYSTPSPTLNYEHGRYQHSNYGHGSAIHHNYSSQPAPVIAAPQSSSTQSAKPIPKAKKPTPATQSEVLPAPLMPTPEPTS